MGRKPNPTQEERILKHLNDYGSITATEALQEYGIMRLASRISDLKEKGYHITRKMEKSRNRYGEAVNYARYMLVKDGI